MQHSFWCIIIMFWIMRGGKLSTTCAFLNFISSLFLNHLSCSDWGPLVWDNVFNTHLLLSLAKKPLFVYQNFNNNHFTHRPLVSETANLHNLQAHWFLKEIFDSKTLHLTKCIWIFFLNPNHFHIKVFRSDEGLKYIL